MICRHIPGCLAFAVAFLLSSLCSAHAQHFELTPCADGTIYEYTNFDDPGLNELYLEKGLKTSLKIQDSYKIIELRYAVIGFDLASVQGHFSPGLLQAQLRVIAKNSIDLSTYNLQCWRVQDEYSDCAVTTSQSGKGQRIEVRTGAIDAEQVMVFDVTDAVEHYLFGTGQTGNAEFFLIGNDDPLIFYDRTDGFKAPLLIISGGPCTDDANCGEEKFCDIATGLCVECVIDSDCDNGKVCHTDMGVCFECVLSSHCPEGYSCVDGQCEYAPWTWMSGSSEHSQEGIYGSRGVPDAANVPGARKSSVSWTDSTGNLWLFGGYYDDGYGIARFNDLWRYDTYTGLWTFMGGNHWRGRYGTKGVPDVANWPGARERSVSWMDSTGNLWLFGGYGSDEANLLGSLNDLWRYDPGTEMWTWMSGSSTRFQSGTYGIKGVPDAANIPGARGYSISWVDSTGDLWLFGGSGKDSAGNSGYLNDLWRYDPGTEMWTWMSGSSTRNQSGTYGTKGEPDAANMPGARGYSISWVDSTGDLWLFGGVYWDDCMDWFWYPDDPAEPIPCARNDLWRYELPFSGCQDDSDCDAGYECVGGLCVELEFTYTVFNDQVTITGSIGTDTAVTIPSTIRGLPVVAIGDSAFRDNADIESVVIPEGVESIGSAAFYKCTSLSSITLPSTLHSIGQFALYRCTSLSSLSTIPAALEDIGRGAFARLSGLSAIEVDPANTAYTSENGVLYTSDMTDLVQFPTGRSGAFMIPGSVKVIGPYAFAWSGVSSVVIPEGVESIDAWAFYYCRSLRSIVIPESVPEIGDRAFLACRALSEAHFLGDAPVIGVDVFAIAAGDFRVCYTNGTSGFDVEPWTGYNAQACGYDQPPVIIYGPVPQDRAWMWWGLSSNAGLPAEVQAVADSVFWLYEDDFVSCLGNPSISGSAAYRTIGAPEWTALSVAHWDEDSVFAADLSSVPAGEYEFEACVMDCADQEVCSGVRYIEIR